GPLHIDDFWTAHHQLPVLHRRIVLRSQHQCPNPVLPILSQSHSKRLVAIIILLFLPEVCGRECLLVSLRDCRWLVFLVELTKHDTHFVISEVLTLEDLHRFVRVLFIPSFAIPLFNPTTVCFCDPVSLIPESLRFFFKLLACVDNHNASAMALGFVVP